MNDLRLMLVFLVALVLILLVATLLLVAILVKILKSLLTEQTLESQRLRNQILAMGDLSALERLNKTTGVERNLPNPSNPQRDQDSLSYDPQDVINTPTGPAIDIMVDGQMQRIALNDLPPELAQAGWTLDPDLDADALVDPEGSYHAGSNSY